MPRFMAIALSGILLTTCILIGSTAYVSAQNMPAACRSVYQTYQALRGAKAFAVGQKRCAYWHGLPTAEANRANALGECQRQERGRCRILHTSR